MINIAECTGMDKAFKAEMIHAMCLRYIEDKMPGIDSEKARSLAKIKAESLIYQKITHNQFNEIIDGLKKDANDR